MTLHIPFEIRDTAQVFGESKVDLFIEWGTLGDKDLYGKPIYILTEEDEPVPIMKINKRGILFVADVSQSCSFVLVVDELFEKVYCLEDDLQ